jgi:DCN1-like protein 4/5
VSLSSALRLRHANRSLARISSLPQLALALKDIENLLIIGNEPVTSSSPSKGKRGSGTIGAEPYNKQKYWEYSSGRKDAMSKLYMFCFALAKPE